MALQLFPTHPPTLVYKLRVEWTEPVKRQEQRGQRHQLVVVVHESLKSSRYVLCKVANPSRWRQSAIHRQKKEEAGACCLFGVSITQRGSWLMAPGGKCFWRSQVFVKQSVEGVSRFGRARRQGGVYRNRISSWVVESLAMAPGDMEARPGVRHRQNSVAHRHWGGLSF